MKGLPARKPFSIALTYEGMDAFDFSSPAGRELLRSLYAFARAQYDIVYKKEVNNRGKSFKDYVTQALDAFLRAPEKHDPNKSSLDFYLKYHLIKRDIINDLPPHVKKAYKEQRNLSVEDAEMVHLMAGIETLPDPDELSSDIVVISEHDRKLLFSEIEADINGDTVVEIIYLAVAQEKYNLSDRAEICEQWNIGTKDFDNGKRRFITILRRVFKKLQMTAEDGN